MASVHLGPLPSLDKFGSDFLKVCVREAGSPHDMLLGHCTAPLLKGPQGILIPMATRPPGLSLLLLLHFAAWGQQAISPRRYLPPPSHPIPPSPTQSATPCTCTPSPRMPNRAQSR